MIRYLRLEFDQLKERLYKTLICCIPRFRKIPVNCFGFFFWKEISKHTAKDQIKKCEQDIHSKSAAVEYCQQQISIKIPLDRPQWEMNYVENYSDSQSLLILKFHHAFSDGAGILNSMLFANKTEHISPEMRKGRAIPFYLEILNGLLFPIFILIASFELIRFNWNGYDKIKTKSGENSGENICVCSKQYNFEDIRKAYKQYDKATMNSFMMGIISKSISEWYHMNGVEETKNISTIIPVVMKPFSPNINEINIENCTSGITFRFPLKDNLNDAIRETSKNFGFYYQLPHLIIEGIKNLNVACGKETMYICDKEIKNIYGFLAPFCRCNLTLTYNSYRQNAQVQVTADKQLQMDPCELVSLIEKNLDEQVLNKE